MSDNQSELREQVDDIHRNTPQFSGTVNGSVSEVILLTEEDIQKMNTEVMALIEARENAVKMLITKRVPRRHLKGWHFMGKQINDMNVEELLDTIEMLGAELQDYKKSQLTHPSSKEEVTNE